MVATSGARLISEDAVEELRMKLLPAADVLTPNIPEAEVLSGRKITSREEMEAGSGTDQQRVWMRCPAKRRT